MKKIEEKILKNAVLNAKNLTHVMLNLKRANSSAGRKIVIKYINYYNIDTSHFETTSERFERVLRPYLKYVHRKPNSEIFVENSTYLNGYNLKKRLYEEGLKERKCEKCGQDENWHGEHMSLILDHINGIHNDNRLENLRIVCPNCNATLSTHCKGAKGLIVKNKEKITIKKNRTTIKKTKDKQLISLKQRKVKRPSYEQLLSEIKELGYSGTGRKYGVSDNAIRKWVKFYVKHK